MNNVVDAFITHKKIIQMNFIDKLDNIHYVVNFKNGLFELRTGKFRKRTIEDFYTKTLNYNYSLNYDKEMYHFIKIMFQQICNDDDATVETLKAFLGYCMTGEIKEEKSWWSIGMTAQNGKTKLFEAFYEMFRIYSKKLSNQTFEKGYTKRHKQYTHLRNKRFVYIEELPRERQDENEIKDRIGGKEIGSNEVMYGTTEDIPIFFKIVFISNFTPKFKSDAGIRRRGLCLEHTNRFLSKREYDTIKNKKGVYLRNNDIGDYITQDNFKLALFHFILPYATQYYVSGFSNINLEPLEKKWEEICGDNDKMSLFIDEKYTKTGKDSDRICKDDLLEEYQHYYNLKNITWATIINDIKRIGLEYDRSKRVNGKRGVIIGLVKKNEDNKDNDIEVLGCL